MPLTNHAKYQILCEYFSGSNSGSPSIWYLGLSTTAIGADGTTVTEPTGAAGYARIPINVSASAWNIDKGTVYSASNLIASTFTSNATAWGTIVCAFLGTTTASYATSGSDVWFYYTFSPAVTMQANSTLPVPIGNIATTIT